MFQTDPISRKDIREIAYRFRKAYRCNDCLVFPLIEVLDALSEQHWLDYQIIEDDDALLDDNTLALYDLNSNMIYIKSSVYQEALDGIGRSRFTITHELAHFIFFNVLGFSVQEVEEIEKPYMDPEWQANTLAAELLAPYHETKHMSVTELMENCCISEEAAIVITQKRKQR